jgi:hypothetical protein
VLPALGEEVDSGSAGDFLTYEKPDWAVLFCVINLDGSMIYVML